MQTSPQTAMYIDTLALRISLLAVVFINPTSVLPIIGLRLVWWAVCLSDSKLQKIVLDDVQDKLSPTITHHPHDP
eukprot:5400487-Amphidinium_carterae.1